MNTAFWIYPLMSALAPGRRGWLCLSGILLTAGYLAAQTCPASGNCVAADYSEPPQFGYQLGQTLAISDIESINPLSGVLMLTIPLASFPVEPGGAMQFGLKAVYSSQIYQAFPDSGTSAVSCQDGSTAHIYRSVLWPSGSGVPLHAGGGWQVQSDLDYSLEYEVKEQTSLNCTTPGPYDLYVYRTWLRSPDGSRHLLHLTGNTASNANPPQSEDPGGYYIYLPDGYAGSTTTSCGGATQLTGTLTYYTDDGTYARLELTPGTTGYTTTPFAGSTWELIFPDGKRIIGKGTTAVSVIDRNCTNPASSSACSPIQRLAGSDGGMNLTATYQDALGRQITATTTAGSGGELTTTYAAAGFNGSVNNWIVTQHQRLGTGQYSYVSADVNPCGALRTTQGYSDMSYLYPSVAVGIDSIQLPDPDGANLAYHFSYNIDSGSGWGEISNVTTPYGESAAYHYFYDGNTSRSALQLTVNELTSRVVTYTDGLGVQRSETTNYAPTPTSFLEGTSETYTDPDGGSHTLQACVTGTFGPICREIKPNGDMVERSYLSNCLPQVWPNGSITTNPILSLEFRTTHGMTAISYYNYDRNGNVIEVDHSDWVPHSSLQFNSQGFPIGPPSGTPWRRQTTTTYAATTGPLIYSCAPGGNNADDANGYWHYKPTWLLSEKVLETVTGEASTLTTAYTYGTNPPNTNSLAGNPSSIQRSGTGIPQTLSTQYVYDTYGNTTQVVDPNGNVTFYNRAGCSVPVYPGYVIKAYGTALAEQTNFWWDCASGLLTETQDPNSIATKWTYDAIGRPTLVQAALGAADESDTAYIYSEPLTAAAPIVVSECRDLTSNVCLPWLNSGGGSANGGVVTTRKFDQRGQLVSSVSGDTTVVSLNRIAVPGDSASYDAVSNPFIATADASMGWTRRKYDQEGRLVATDYFGGDTCSGGGPCPYPWGSDNSNIGEATVVYNGAASAPFNGTQWTVTDEVGNSRTLENDGLGRLAFVQEGSFGYTTSYGYDVDRLSSVTQGLQTRGFGYDAAGRLLTATNPETGTVTYTYDNNGNLKTRKDAVGRVATYLYDALDRVTEKEYADGPASSYAKTYWALYCYDAPLTPAGACPAAGTKTAPFIGRLAQVYAGGIAQDYWNYDHFGRPTYTLEYVNGTSYAFPSYTYNKQGGVSSITYPSGRVVNYTFDGSGRTATVQGTKGSTTTAYAGGPGTNGAIVYWGNGAIHQVNLAGGALSQSFTYNHRFWPASIAAAAGGSSLLNLGYTFYDNGNVHTATIGNPGLSATLTQTFNYDSVNRLTGASESGGANEWAQNFGYDQFGNRSLLSSSTFNPYTGLTPQSAAAGTGPFTGSNQWTGAGYDGAGNQTSVLGTGSDSALYDTENRLATVIEPNVSVIQYSYDGDGKRVMKVVCPAGTSACTPAAVGAVATVYVYDAQGEMVEEAGPSTDAGTKYLFGDGLGSTRLETNAAGGSVRCIDYAPFGLELPAGMGGRGSCYATMSYPSGTPDILDAKFTGKERDAETGLDFFESRYYSSAQGRFTSPDEFKGGFLDAFSGKAAFQEGPLPYANIADPQTLNKYVYVRNNPLRYTDPDGHCVEVVSCTLEFAGGGTAIGGPVGTIVGGVIGAGVGVFLGYEIGTHLFPSTPAPAQTPPSTSTDLTTGTPGTPAGTNVNTGTPASTSQQGTVNMSPMESRIFPQGVKDSTRQNAGGQCEYCGAQTVPGQKSQAGVSTPANQGQTDHYNPYSTSQDSSAGNAVHACATCNNVKSNTQPQGTKWELHRMKKPDDQE